MSQKGFSSFQIQQSEEKRNLAKSHLHAKQQRFANPEWKLTQTVYLYHLLHSEHIQIFITF